MVQNSNRIDLLKFDGNHLHNNCKICSTHYEEEMFAPN